MIPTITPLGSSFKGASLYYLHDKDALTKQRVAWSHVANMMTDDPEMAWRIMAYTAANARELKQLAGGSGGGNKLKKPVFSFSLAWHPEQKPDKEHMIETAESALGKLGLSEYQYYLVAHNDEPQPHVHVVVNRVHPDTGLVWEERWTKARIQAWALQYQRERAETYAPQREINAKKRAERRYDKSKPAVSHQDPVIAKAWQQSDSGRAFKAALEAEGYRLAQGNKRIVVVDKWGKVLNPTRYLKGVKAQDLKDRLADIDLSKLPKAETLQREAKKRSRSQYHAERAGARSFNNWAQDVRNRMQDRQIDERARLHDDWHRKGEALKEQMKDYYKIHELQKQVQDLAARVKKPSVWRKMTGKASAEKDQLTALRLNLQDAQERVAEKTTTFEAQRSEALEQQERRHVEERRRAEDMIAKREPEFYAEARKLSRPAETELTQEPPRRRSQGREGRSLH